MSEHTTNLTKRLAVRFLEHILPKKRWNLEFCDFFAKNLREQKLLNTLRLCYEIESFTKNTFIWEVMQSWHLLVVS